MYTNLPKSCLTGIVLTISTHSGPLVVYHYPPLSQPCALEKERNVGGTSSSSEQTGEQRIGSGMSFRYYSNTAEGEVEDNVSSSSSGNVSDATSGLSDSELSTDYADYSSSSSSSESENESGRARGVEEEEAEELEEVEEAAALAAAAAVAAATTTAATAKGESANSHTANADSTIPEPLESGASCPFPIDSSFNQMLEAQSVVASSINVPAAITTAAPSTKPKSIKSRHSQISANKLFQYLSTNNDIAESRRPSVFSRLTSNEDIDLMKMNESGNLLDLDSLPRALEDIEDIDVSNILDARIFQSEYFQDVSKIMNFNSEFVAEICCPPKDMCNTRFEFTIDESCFLGLPIHVDESGRWRKRRNRKTPLNTRSKRSESGGAVDTTDTSLGRAGSSGSKAHEELQQNEQQQQNIDSDLGEGLGIPVKSDQGGGGYEHEGKTQRDDNEEMQKAVNMFHVCFIMNPQLVEYNERVDDMYHYVVTRLSLILRYLQDKTGYVVEECHKILKTRDRILKQLKQIKKVRGQQALQGCYLYEYILKSSSLARALTKCFNSIVNNETVSLEIGKYKVLSLQIPIKNEFAKLPDLKINPVLRGSFLTSILNLKFLKEPTDPIPGGAVVFNDSNFFDEENDILDYALLPLDEVSNIIRDLECSSFQSDMINLLMANLVKILKPTVPLRSYLYLIDELLGTNSTGANTVDGGGVLGTSSSKIQAHRNSFECNMLRSIALHLTYWRHTRIILPISSKNTYIVSPLAPIRGTAVDDCDSRDMDIVEGEALIYQNQEIFHSKFPTLPTLPSFLSSISTLKPRSFGHLIPSKEHKFLYLNALSWLIRYGYLTQLLTFVWIRVDRRIKVAVDEDLEREGVRKWNRKSKKEINNPHDNVVTVKKPVADGGPDRTAKATEQDFTDTTAADTKTTVTTTTVPTTTVVPTPADATTPASNAGVATHATNSDSYSDEQESLDGDLFEQRDYTIILEPKTATALEKRWLYKCIEGQPTDIQMLFRKIVKYFNGKTPLEWIVLKEGVSKHELKRLLASLGDYAVELRHW